MQPTRQLGRDVPPPSHAFAAADHAEELKIAGAETARLLNEVGLYLSTRAEYGEARTVFERALTLDERVHGPEHPRVAIGANTLGSVLQRRATTPVPAPTTSRRSPSSSAPTGPSTQTSPSAPTTSAASSTPLGDLAGARAHHELALAIDERALGAEHPPRVGCARASRHSRKRRSPG